METLGSDVLSTLVDFGLSDVEVSVYSTGLSLGSRPASVIANKAGLKRGHTYNVLETLSEKGFVQEFVKNSVRHFTCSPPNSLLTILEKRERELALQRQKLEKIIPHLEQLRNPLAAQPKVKFYKGLEGIKEIFNDMVQVPGQDIYGVCDVAYSWTFLSGEGFEWINDFIKRRAERNIWWFGIMNKSDATDYALQTREWVNRKVKCVEGLDFPVEISIYGSKVAFTCAAGDTFGVLVENEPIADTLRSIHQKIWEVLPDYKVEC